MIEFDPAKDALNRRKHGVSLALAARFEWDTAQIEEDTRFEYGEQRFKATGLIGGGVHILIYCYGDEATRIISLRPAEKQETKRYVHYLEGRSANPYAHR